MENHQLIRKLVQAEPNPRGLSSGDDMSDRAGRPQAKRGRTTATEPAASTSATARGARGTRGRTRGRPKKRGTAATSTSKSSRVGSRGGVDDAENDVTDRDELQETPLVPGADPKAAKTTMTATDTSKEPGLDAEFLAALPPDIRAEIEATHMLEVLKNRQRAQEIREKAAQADSTTTRGSNPSEKHHHHHYHHHNNHNSHPTDSAGNPSKTASALEKPMLMGRREIGELRTMISVWVKSTLVYNEEPPDSAAGSSSHGGGSSKGPLLDEGPNPDDVRSFSDFLTRVIVMERDLDRVRMVLRWLKRRVEENEQLLLVGEDNLTQERKQLLELQKVIVLCTWRQALDQTLSTISRVVLRVYGGRFVLD